MNFANLRSLVIPEGEVDVIACGAEILWRTPYKREVAYLETDGTQYIKTGITVTGNTRVVAEMMCSEKGTAGSYVYMFASATPLFCVRMHWSNGRPYCRYGDTTSQIFYVTGVGVPLDINYGSGVATISDPAESYKRNFDYVDFTDGELQMFALNGGNRAKGRVWQFAVYDEETLVCDYIPVLDWDDVPCLYDKVSGELFYNAGTGEFLYGEVETS